MPPDPPGSKEDVVKDTQSTGSVPSAATKEELESVPTTDEVPVQEGSGQKTAEDTHNQQASWWVTKFIYHFLLGFVLFCLVLIRVSHILQPGKWTNSLFGSRCLFDMYSTSQAGLILGLRQANERQRYFVTTFLIGWAQA